MYVLIGGIAAILNFVLFLLIYQTGVRATVSALVAFAIAAVANYFMCITTIFRQRAKWTIELEVITYITVVAAVAIIDIGTTVAMLDIMPAGGAKLCGTAASLIANFVGRRFFVFTEPTRGPWNPGGSRHGTLSDKE